MHDTMCASQRENIAIGPGIDSDYEAEATADSGLHSRVRIFDHNGAPGQYADPCCHLDEHGWIRLAGVNGRRLRHATHLRAKTGEMERPMEASDIMSRPVVTVALDTPVTELARIMIEKRISAVPVMDQGTMVGIVTEGDLLRRDEIGSEHGRSRWAELAFATWNLAAEYTKEHGRRASDVMTHKVIMVAPTATLVEIADILESRHIKRVPVGEKGKLVGIVSRANLVQALASSRAGLPLPTTPLDRDIRARLCGELNEHPWSFTPTEANVIVNHGEVHLWGYIGTESARRAIVVICIWVIFACGMERRCHLRQCAVADSE
jgi:CBS domain-containing protein